jgi:PEP-CTERM motif
LNLNKLLATSAAAMAALLTPLAAQSAPVLAAKISDGFSTVTIMDGGVGDLAAADGIITFFGLNLFGNWDVSFATGTSTFDPLAMHLTASFSASTSNFGVGESRVLSISLSQTGLGAGSGSGVVAFGAGGGGNGQFGTTGSWNAYADDTDALFGTGTAVASAAGFTTVSGGVSAPMTDTYSATLVTSFDISKVAGSLAAGSLDLNMNVPEPGTIALAGLALLGLGAARRRKA